jgi:parallel beta-helix repeat protein
MQIIRAHINTVGGSETDRNIISGNIEHGILITEAAATENLVTHNYIGLNPNGDRRVGNGGDGVRIRDADRNELFGNVISGNANGVFIRGANNTRVESNRIGTDSAGLMTDPNGIPGDGDDLGNLSSGVLIWSGDATLVRFNTVSGNRGSGVEISDMVGFADGTAASNVIFSNTIGLNSAGTQALPNAGDGVVLSASFNLVGSETPGTFNVISGNGGAGVLLRGAAATNNRVEANRIGTNAAGDAARPNSRGVEVRQGANLNTIGGTSAAERNIISGNDVIGVWIFGANDNEVFGNYIGVRNDGSTPIPNGHGVILQNGATANRIGDGTPERRNLISGNANDGVRIQAAHENFVMGNDIGTNAAGNSALPNQGFGVIVQSGDNNAIVSNVISRTSSAVSPNPCATLSLETRGAGSSYRAHPRGTTGSLATTSALPRA